MALIANPAQGSCSTFSSRPLPCTQGLKLKTAVCLHFVGRDICSSLKKHCLFSVKRQPIICPTGKPFKVSSFKGSPQNDESVGKSNGMKCTKKFVKLSHTPQERDETVTRSSDVQNVPLSYESEDGDNGMVGSPVIQNLFKKWLMMLRTHPSSQTDEVFSGPSQCENIPETQSGSLRLKAGNVLKAALGFFFGLDVAIQIPLLLFIPFYLAVNMVYGAEISRELTPLWIIGPPVIALYVRLIQGVCALYVYCFKLLVTIITNLPTYCKLATSYIAEGKLKAFLYARLCQPIVDIMYFDYGGLLRQKMKQLQDWAVEKYLDYVESIWPHYCRTIRFLKKANLI
ncbi:hypothetical protein QJS04_geneDACA002777 [Acorus gramineus]|uniref:Embryo defective 2759 n=1 Tax=Acorus gramineus TaxID=55184 RepID=A0AAV9BU59_ACOGR|nr:hypothetical protein QJS04_geneDACA002777 [Acorus gramineus]